MFKRVCYCKMYVKVTARYKCVGIFNVLVTVRYKCVGKCRMEVFGNC